MTDIVTTFDYTQVDEEAHVPFDFSIVSGENRERALVLDAQLGAAIQRLNYTVDEIGEICIEMKDILPHGTFQKWHMGKGLSERQANYAMNKIRKGEILQNVGFEISDIRTFEPEKIPERTSSILDEPIFTEEALELAREEGRQQGFQEALESIQDDPTFNRHKSGMGIGKTDKYNSPKHIIELASLVMGGIDLDPCSNSHEAPNVPATTHYTEEDDGLPKVWYGSVFMNPPYGDVIVSWLKKLLDEYHSGNVDQAIMLLPAYTDPQWFKLVRDYPLCFVGRLKFGNEKDPAAFASMMVYLGEHVSEFIEICSPHGPVMQRKSTLSEIVHRSAEL